MAMTFDSRGLLRPGMSVIREFGVCWQSEAATVLWGDLPSGVLERKSGVTLRLPPQSKFGPGLQKA
jgi:hypothetical protein